MRATRLLAAAAFFAGLAPADAATIVTPPNASFESGSLLGWTSSGDVSVQTLAPCLQPQMPSDGIYAACLSTESLFGGTAVGDVLSELESPPVSVTFRPLNLTVTFDFEFGTEELPRSVGFDDLVSFTLLTGAGPLPILVSGTWGTTLPGKGVTLGGAPALTFNSPGCPVTLQTGRVNVTWKRTFTVAEQTALQNAPIVLQIVVSDRGDDARLSFACIDNLTIKASKS